MEKKKKKLGCLPTAAIIIVILVACIAVGAIVGSSNDDSYSPSIGNTASETENRESTDPDDNVVASVFSIPGTLSCEYFDITIVSAEVYDKITLNAGIDCEYTPDDGKQFLVLCVDATNTSDEIRNVGSFASYVDNVTVLENNILAKYGDRALFVGAVDPGKTMQCYVMWQVPTDWQVFEFSYCENSWSGERSELVAIYHSDIAE